MAFLNDFASSILTSESGGKTAAETNAGTNTSESKSRDESIVALEAEVQDSMS
jgi:hypothetical protein